MWLVLRACMFPTCGAMLCMHVLCAPTCSVHAYANLCTHVCCLCVPYVCTCSAVCGPLDTSSLGLCVHKYVCALCIARVLCAWSLCGSRSAHVRTHDVCACVCTCVHAGAGL